MTWLVLPAKHLYVSRVARRETGRWFDTFVFYCSGECYSARDGFEPHQRQWAYLL